MRNPCSGLSTALPSLPSAAAELRGCVIFVEMQNLYSSAAAELSGWVIFVEMQNLYSLLKFLHPALYSVLSRKTFWPSRVSTSPSSGRSAFILSRYVKSRPGASGMSFAACSCPHDHCGVERRSGAERFWP